MPEIQFGYEPNEDEEWICPTCNGSGETISGAPGNCYRCKGRGVLKYEEPEQDPDDCDDNRCRFRL